MSSVRTPFLQAMLRGTIASWNRSPWLGQLHRRWPVQKITADQEADVAVIGAGIAGVSTAYFILKYTNREVLLIEGNKVAHGATGHNAGQVVSYFERQVTGLVEEFGLEMTARAQQDINSAWDLITEIYQDTAITTPLSRFIGLAGCQDAAEILVHLQNTDYCVKAGIPYEPMVIAEGAAVLDEIPAAYSSYYTLRPHAEILQLLETKDPQYVAIVMNRKGVMNSALFCEDLLEQMLTLFPGRLQIVEHSPMSEAILETQQIRLKIKEYTVTAKNVVLCTNGFERFTLTNQAGPEINTKFHNLVRGTVGYMAAYAEPAERDPIAISYLPAHSNTKDPSFDEGPYFYLTRRRYTDAQQHEHNLICIGGPEAKMDDTNGYKAEHPYPAEAQKVIDHFLATTYAYAPPSPVSYVFRWHGLMGYTPNGVRCIGPEPANPRLFYNLGCNGVGILPSLYGGKKISQLLAGEKLPPAIFDPQ